MQLTLTEKKLLTLSDDTSSSRFPKEFVFLILSFLHSIKYIILCTFVLIVFAILFYIIFSIYHFCLLIWFLQPFLKNK